MHRWKTLTTIVRCVHRSSIDRSPRKYLKFTRFRIWKSRWRLWRATGYVRDHDEAAHEQGSPLWAIEGAAREGQGSILLHKCYAIRCLYMSLALQFPGYIKEHETTLSVEDKTRYQNQLQKVTEIVAIFEDPSYADDDYEKNAKVVNLMNEVSRHLLVCMGKSILIAFSFIHRCNRMDHLLQKSWVLCLLAWAWGPMVHPNYRMIVLYHSFSPLIPYSILIWSRMCDLNNTHKYDRTTFLI